MTFNAPSFSRAGTDSAWRGIGANQRTPGLKSLGSKASVMRIIRLKSLALEHVARIAGMLSDVVPDVLVALPARTVPVMLGTLSRVFRLLPKNGVVWAYTIRGYDGSAYIDRMILPRVCGIRPIVHGIHRPDTDLWLHNHPWLTARFLIVSGGYVEERAVGPVAEGCRERHSLTAGDINVLDGGDYHRIVSVQPDTWTVGIVGERGQPWGFFVDGEGFVEAEAYFARKQYASEGVRA